LRRFFNGRGILLSAAAIAGAVSAHSVQAAPIGLATTVTVAAVKGTTVAASTLTLVKGALNIMAWTKAKTALVAGAAIILAGSATTVIVMKVTSLGQSRTNASEAEGGAATRIVGKVTLSSASADPKSQLAKMAPAIDRVLVENTDLPSLQVQAKTLVFSAVALRKVPEAANWCETLNANGKLWPTTPSNTVFALNSGVAGRALRTLPGDTVVFFETSKPGWNQAGGAELLAKRDRGVAVALADGRALFVDPRETTGLRWAPWVNAVPGKPRPGRPGLDRSCRKRSARLALHRPPGSRLQSRG
jgi:hypothetical protein